MLTYNAFLFVERNNMGFSRRKMAKFLKMPLFYYSMVEKGYFKPTKKQIAKISEKLEVDYEKYLDGEPSYPSELPEKKRNKIVSFFYKVIGHFVFKVIFAVLSGASVAFMITGFIVQNQTETNTRNYYSSEYLSFIDNLKENGSVHISTTSDLTNPEYLAYEKDEIHKTSKYISIVGKYADSSAGNLSFTATYRTETSRLIYTLTYFGEEYPIVSAKYSEYDSSIVYSGAITGHKNINAISYTDDHNHLSIFQEGDEHFEEYKAVLLSKINDYQDDFNKLISEKDPTFAVETSNKLIHLLDLQREGSNKISRPLIYAFFGRYFGIILSGLNLFILAYAFLYGTTKKGEKVYVQNKLTIQVDDVHRIKSDIKFAPFIPETVLEIVGIILVFIGSFRLIFYVGSYLSGNSALAMSSSTGSNLMQTFMVGMFLLYFIDFDIFLDDKRMVRNIVLYSIVFFCLYGLENLLYRVFDNGSIVGSLLTMVHLPNMFSSIACYYLIMLFLFYSPKFLKKKWQLIIYRCMSIIPAAYIFVAWYLYNGYNVLFNADWPMELRNIFNGEKIPFSILAVSYLFGLYALRFVIVLRYGKDKALTFFNGNRFIWYKNIMVCTIILIIGIVELCLKNNPTANKLGLGMYWNILFLIPLLLFYHPHKGPRNLLLDWTTLFFYIVAISFSYIAVILMVLTKMVS